MHLLNLKSMASSQKRSHDPDYAPFKENFTPDVGLAVVDLLAKFKQCSSFIAEILMGFKILKMSRDLHHPNFEGKFLLLRWDLS